MPEWTKLSTYHDKKWKSFEELCYQLAYRLFSSRGEISRIDDSGGGDGVEFYLTLPNGTEWGWQTKYYPPGSRLKDGNRKKNILKSFQRSLKAHPRLKRWILCTTMTFTTAEISWFKSALGAINDRVTLQRWDESRFDAFLSDPRTVGIRNFFFGKLEFTPDFFRNQVEGELKNLRDKFNPELHTEGNPDLLAHALLADQKLLVHLQGLMEEILARRSDFSMALEAARSCSVGRKWKRQFEGAIKLSSEFDVCLSKSVLEIERLMRLVQKGQSPDIQTVKLERFANELRTTATRHDEVLRNWKNRFAAATTPKADGMANEKSDRFRHLMRRVSAPLEPAQEIHSLISDASYFLNKAVQSSLHIFGTAGLGKTHLVCNVCSERVETDLPALLLSGKRFSGDADVKSKIMELCDVPRTYSFQDFLSALDSYAFSRRTRVVIGIDALNESMDPTVWEAQLGSLESAIEGFERVALITTCRTSYLRAIWKGGTPSNPAFIHGFVAENVDQAIGKYFAYYKIEATLTLSTLEQFKNPLYLKIFCEAENPDRVDQKVVHAGDQTFMQVFETFLKKVNDRLSARLAKPPHANLVLQRLSDLGLYLWRHNARSVEFATAIELLDKVKVDDVNWDTSFSRLLEEEGLLITRDWAADAGQFVSFTYDLMGGFLIARGCLDGLGRKDLQKLIVSPDFKKRLVTEDYKELHPLHEDILRCMCVLLPAKGQIYVHENALSSRVFSRAIHSLFEMEPNYVKPREVQILTKLFSVPENRKPLLAEARGTAFNPVHPLNWEFWGKLLAQLSVADRDESWTEQIRRDAGTILKLASEFESTCTVRERFTPLEERRLGLAAQYFKWVLTSTNHRLRDLATRALYWYGRRFPKALFSLTLESLGHNDPYVPERMLAASYGVAMALYKAQENEEFGKRILPRFASALYKEMFSRSARHSTTHALTRDYARHTIDIALLVRPDALDKDARLRVKPPYRHGGVRRLRKGKDRNPGQYRGNFPLGMDFHNYTLGRLVRSRRNYDFANPTLKKIESHVWWRIYDLGYSLERFGQIDERIAKEHWQVNRMEENSTRIDRYGKKYAWVAFYEIFGFLQDKGALDGDGEGRPSDVDIEPSFPDPPRPIKILSESFLEPSNLSPKEWVVRGPAPDIARHIVLKELDGEYGPWVLLEGNIYQEDETIGHRISLNVLGLFTSSGSVNRTMKLAKESISQGYWLPRTPELYYSFVGEIPWCDSIPQNGKTELEFVTSIKKRKETPAEVAERLRWQAMSDRLSKSLGLKSGRGGECQGPLVKQVPTIEKLAVMVPTLYMGWESYHTAATKCQGLIIAKDVALPLGLWVRLPSMDMYDQKGKRAAITVKWGDHWTNGQSMVYLRQDLFEELLTANGLGCVWGVWGQRDYPLKFYQDPKFQQKKGIRWAEFKDSFAYKNGKLSRR